MTRRGRLSALLLMAAALAATTWRAQADGTRDGEAALRRRGLAVLPELLTQVDAPDPAVRLRARRLAKLIVTDHLQARTPPGMRLMLEQLVVTRKGVRFEKGFYLAVHEVTLGEFRRFLQARRWPGTRWAEGADRLPVTRVTLHEARAYAEWRRARLPAREELEWAATGGGRFRYPWGDRFAPERVNSREAGPGRVEVVGHRRGGYSIHGFADLRGNVAEWTETATGRPQARRYCVVGGSYRGHARSARFVTYKMGAEARQDDVGFRLAKSLPPLPPTTDKGS
ncbi:MAG: formylglycine-generating enzyme family protein [Planctomycetota bacterium]